MEAQSARLRNDIDAEKRTFLAQLAGHLVADLGTDCRGVVPNPPSRPGKDQAAVWVVAKLSD